MIPACVKPLNNGAFDTASVAALETIQEMADNICASVAYNSGDRMTTDRIHDKTVQHPLVARLPVPGNLYVGAAALWGWFFAARLSELL